MTGSTWFLTSGKLLGEDFNERMNRFGLIVENAERNWDLSDRDENALRTANALLAFRKAEIERLRRRIDGLELNAEIVDRNTHDWMAENESLRAELARLRLKHGGVGMGMVYGPASCGICGKMSEDYHPMGRSQVCVQCFEGFPESFYKAAEEQRDDI